MEASIGVNLRVTAHSNQGGRKYMEDVFSVAYQPTTDDRDLLYAYFGIFDGHGGKDAALFAKQHLMDHIVGQKNFWAEDDRLILKAIRDGFISTHYAMWKELETWPKTLSGLPSTSGTTASIAFVRRGKVYIGHVGDSAIVLGYQDPVTGYWRAKPLTKDHKPENLAESDRISRSGGKVIRKSGVPRVVWNRPRVGHKGPVRRSTRMDEIPFLAVARSLGDLWSYNSNQNEFVVSPEPDVSVLVIDVNTFRCLILGSDGLWNMLNAQDAVNTVYFAEKNNERQFLASSTDTSSSQVKNWINPSKRLVDRALDRWYHHNLRADNTSVVTVVIDPPGPRKAQVLRQAQKNCAVRPGVKLAPTESVPAQEASMIQSEKSGSSNDFKRPSADATKFHKPSCSTRTLSNARLNKPLVNAGGSCSSPKLLKPSENISTTTGQGFGSYWNEPRTSSETNKKDDDVQIHEISSSSEAIVESKRFSKKRRMNSQASRNSDQLVRESSRRTTQIRQCQNSPSGHENSFNGVKPSAATIAPKEIHRVIKRSNRIRESSSTSTLSAKRGVNGRVSVISKRPALGSNLQSARTQHRNIAKTKLRSTKKYSGPKKRGRSSLKDHSLRSSTKSAQRVTRSMKKL